jgi:hypothetical protein
MNRFEWLEMKIRRACPSDLPRLQHQLQVAQEALARHNAEWELRSAMARKGHSNYMVEKASFKPKLRK